MGRSKRRDKKRRSAAREVAEFGGIKVGDMVRSQQFGRDIGPVGTVLRIKTRDVVGNRSGSRCFAHIKWQDGAMSVDLDLYESFNSLRVLDSVEVLALLDDGAKRSCDLDSAARDRSYDERQTPKPRKWRCVLCGKRIFKPGSIDVHTGTPENSWRPICVACHRDKHLTCTVVF